MSLRAQLHAQEDELRISQDPIVLYSYYTGTLGYQPLKWISVPMFMVVHSMQEVDVIGGVDHAIVGTRCHTMPHQSHADLRGE